MTAGQGKEAGHCSDRLPLHWMKGESVESEDFGLQTKSSYGKLPSRMIRSGYIFGDSVSSVPDPSVKAGPHRESTAGLPGERDGGRASA